MQQLGQNKFVENALKYGFSFWGTPKTGQTTKYRDGDDGDLEKGYPLNPPRFRDNGDNTITDIISGLMWVKDPGAIGGDWGSAGSPNGFIWNLAIDRCAALTYAGYSDWRLCNIKELQGLVDFGKRTPAIDTAFFPTGSNDVLWTSTTMLGITTAAAYINFSEGRTTFDDKGFAKKPRPVRGP